MYQDWRLDLPTITEAEASEIQAERTLTSITHLTLHAPSSRTTLVKKLTALKTSKAATATRKANHTEKQNGGFFK